jgi:peptidoglycan/xylan/chitin deacetylase (PgdA/CDA1 family)
MKHGIKLLAGLIVPAVLLAGGCDTDDKDPVSVSGVALNKTSLTLAVGETETLVPKVDPENASDKAVTWRSRNTAVAGVDASGAVTAVAPGTTAVIVTTNDGKKTDYCTVIVVPSKAGIEAFIDGHWEEYGYSARPVKYIALSFDDGPSGVTQNLLNVLDDKKVQATFFLIGQNVRSNKTAAKAMFNRGHELGNHSDGYSPLGNSSAEAITGSLTAASAAIEEITGEDPVLFRAPNVDYGTNLTRVCTEMGLAIIGVSVWSSDWEGIDTQTIINNVVNNSFLNSGDGGIINCHELANTVAAIPDMIDGLREKGFWIMTVGELAIIKGVNLQAGTRYDSIR